MQLLETSNKEYLISTDSEKLNINAIHSFLSKEADWSRCIPKETLEKSIAHSLNFGMYHQHKLTGFSRVISDYATIAYLGDLFIIEEFRGKVLSKWLMESIIMHPDLQGLRRWILLTSTAEWLYKKYGFQNLARLDIYMEKYDPEVYKVDN